MHSLSFMEFVEGATRNEWPPSITDLSLHILQHEEKCEAASSRLDWKHLNLHAVWVHRLPLQGRPPSKILVSIITHTLSDHKKKGGIVTIK